MTPTTSTPAPAQVGRRRNPIARLIHRIRTYNTIHASAMIAHGLSYLTTLLCVQWITAGVRLDIVTLSVTAYVLEMLLFGMKAALGGDTDDDIVGYAGVGIDSLINTGGLFPGVNAFLLFPPIAALLQVLSWIIGAITAAAGVALPSVTTPMIPVADMELSFGGLIAALLGGILLSAAPRRLWRRAERGA